MVGSKNLIPRRVWIYWHQGISEAPFVVKKCIESWIKENPTWEVTLLDKDNLGEYIDLEFYEKKSGDLNLTKQSNLIRLQLLSEYGGVWADATTLCMRPLDGWIEDCTQSGFFAFHKPGRDRLLATWFLASEKKSPIVIKWAELYVSFFMENSFNIDGKFKKKLIKCLRKLLNRKEETTKFWFSLIVTKLLKVHPYHVFHYMFGVLVSSHPECRIIWSNTKKISAEIPHGPLLDGLLGSVDSDMKKQIDEKHAPLFKLTWKYDPSEYAPSTLLYYLLEGRG